jgi:hypothetical protein
LSIKISERYTCLEVDGLVSASARQRAEGWWEVTCWPQRCGRNQAITALTVAELLGIGYARDHPVITALHSELP